MTINEALNLGQKKLSQNSSSPSLDAEVLLAFALKITKEYIHANPSDDLRIRKRTRMRVRKFQNLINKRANGWPVAYLTGHKEFFGLDFIVNKNVLIPRPETEGLVELVLSKVKGQKSLSILDIGTGSGAIIISLAKNNLDQNYFASDVSKKALAVAKQNAKKHRVKIHFKQGDLLQPWKNQSFDVIVANLPYLAKGTDPSTKFEPKLALIAKKKGLALIEELFKQLYTLFPKPSALILEIGHDQAPAIKILAKKYLPGYKLTILKDLSGKNRIGLLEKK